MAKVIQKPKDQFEFHLEVTGDQGSVVCKFPGGQFSGTASLDLIGPYLDAAMEQLTKVTKQAGGNKK